ncbi:hypothetical protein GWI33_013599 [Rhynchophorus ferrugineus]|uniref:Odorant receptor n=1 Tax=Rhynchophorus ferrugineus TaxID=354439 RepID=A0A834MD38_RHYFE|nr:hypothetical protein GWI33_013599 [Rhynchophorus ferrugineus]
MQIVISAVGVLITCWLIAIKTYICVRKGLIDILDEITEYEGRIMDSNNEPIKRMYLRKASFCNNMCRGQAFVQIICAIAMYYLGIVGDQQLIAYNRANNSTIDSYYWYQFWFPGYKLDHMVWIYTLNLMFGWSACSANVVCHSIIGTLMIFAAAQLQVLNLQLRSFIAEGDDVKRKTAELKTYVRQHQSLISYVSRLNKEIRIIVLMHFMLNSIEIATGVTGLLKDIPVTHVIFLLTYINLTSYQLIMTAWNANEILDQSTSIGDALYASHWRLLNKEGKMICLIMIQRSQKPLTVTIGPFGPMTNQSALMVIKAAYSYISIMNTGN